MRQAGELVRESVYSPHAARLSGVACGEVGRSAGFCSCVPNLGWTLLCFAQPRSGIGMQPAYVVQYISWMPTLMVFVRELS